MALGIQMNTIDKLMHNIEEHRRYTKVQLNCILCGVNEHHHSGKVVLAEVHKITDRNHVLAIGDERFGVYEGYYKVL